MVEIEFHVEGDNIVFTDPDNLGSGWIKAEDEIVKNLQEEL